MPSSEPYSSDSPPQPAVSKEQEINALKEQSVLLEMQLDAIPERIEKLEKNSFPRGKAHELRERNWIFLGSERGNIHGCNSR